jgi:hypothetical protein
VARRDGDRRLVGWRDEGPRCRRRHGSGGVARLGLGRALGLFREEPVTVDDGGREIDQLAVIGA